MTLFTEKQLRDRVSNQLFKGGLDTDSFVDKANKILRESIDLQDENSEDSTTYDIFLSHSLSDATLIAGLKLELQDFGYTVYIDWINDPKLERSSVTVATAHQLKKRMKQSKTLIYAFSDNAAISKWMPWELGYFDGLKGAAAVLPVVRNVRSDFKGTEFVGIYNYILSAPTVITRKQKLWVCESASKYVDYDNWINGIKPYKR